MFIGAAGVFFNDALLGILRFSGIIAYPLLGTSVGVATFVGVVAVILIIFTVTTWKLQKEKLIWTVPDNFPTKRQLLAPLAAIAILPAITYLVITSGLQYEYAIPIALITIGFLVLRGLDRFAKTLPAILALLFCIMFLGTAVAGAFTVTYVPENHYITTTEAPNVNVVNLNVNTNQADIHVYFTEDTTKICQVSFIKQYGPTIVSSRAEYHPNGTYDNEPANNFNYTVQGQQLLVYVDCYSTLVNVTLSQNYSYNLNLFSYFGWITVHDSSSIQAGNYTTQWGHVERLQN
ncbi:MAG: hypothetical protein NWE93_08135 [Candidatus Bathyarchaeota archaeon]|nr:hypothetical protein [Candidatus Bathyarchaeota archaeon]